MSTINMRYVRSKTAPLKIVSFFTIRIIELRSGLFLKGI